MRVNRPCVGMIKPNHATEEDSTMLGVNYSSKKELKARIGRPIQVIETSIFGTEYHETGTFCVVGPDPYRNRKYFANVTMCNGLIVKVS